MVADNAGEARGIMHVVQQPQGAAFPGRLRCLQNARQIFLDVPSCMQEVGHDGQPPVPRLQQRLASRAQIGMIYVKKSVGHRDGTQRSLQLTHQAGNLGARLRIMRTVRDQHHRIPTRRGGNTRLDQTRHARVRAQHGADAKLHGGIRGLELARLTRNIRPRKLAVGQKIRLDDDTGRGPRREPRDAGRHIRRAVIQETGFQRRNGLVAREPRGHLAHPRGAVRPQAAMPD